LQQARVQLGTGRRTGARRIGVGERREILQRAGVRGVEIGEIVQVVLVDTGDGYKVTSPKL